MEALKAEYISQHKANGTFSDSDLEDDGIQIDVVGGTDSDDDLDDAASFQSPRGSSDRAANSYSPSGSPNGMMGSPHSTAGDRHEDDSIASDGGGVGSVGSGGLGMGASASALVAATLDRGCLAKSFQYAPKTRISSFHLNLHNSQHNNNNNNNSTSSNSPTSPLSNHQHLHHQTNSAISIRRSNPFSIESLLFNNT